MTGKQGSSFPGLASSSQTTVRKQLYGSISNQYILYFHAINIILATQETAS